MSNLELSPAGSGASREISGAEILSRLHDPTLAILNVLPQAAFEEGRIPGSLHLPIAEIPARAASLLGDRLRETAVYCGGGG